MENKRNWWNAFYAFFFERVGKVAQNDLSKCITKPVAMKAVRAVARERLLNLKIATIIELILINNSKYLFIFI